VGVSEVSALGYGMLKCRLPPDYVCFTVSSCLLGVEVQSYELLTIIYSCKPSNTTITRACNIILQHPVVHRIVDDVTVLVVLCETRLIKNFEKGFPLHTTCFG
jgi:hypothetical protein